MNVDLLDRVRQHIAHSPDRFCAAQWAFARNAEQVLRNGASPEGFRCCIAGHVLLHHGTLSERALLREGGFHTGGGVWSRAAQAASISAAQAHELFFPSQWDRPFKRTYYLCSRDEEADLAVSYLDHFLNKHGPAGRGPSRTETDRSARAPASASTEKQVRTARIAA
ncbi:MAG: hypothetical protein ABEL97_04580 [Salinibacter sp.]